MEFYEQKGSWPKLLDSGDADALVAIALELSKARQAEDPPPEDGACWLQKIEWGFPSGEPEELDKVVEKLKRYSLLFQAELTGYCAFLGGAIAQEVIKKTGKF